MAIAFDATANQAATGTSLSYSHSCAAGAVIVAALWEISTGTARTGAPTVGGNAMTQIGSDMAWVSDSSRTASLWIYLAPASGANTVAVSFSGSIDACLMSSSYTGCDTTTNPNASALINSVTSGKTMTSTVTSTVDNCWHVAFVSATGTIGVGASTTLRGSSTAYFGSIACGTGDKNAVVSPAGSNTLNFTCSTSSARARMGLMLAPGAASSNSNFLALL
jgi:hypothetical protein